MKNAPQVCCLTTRLRGLLSLNYKTIQSLSFRKGTVFSPTDNTIINYLSSFHIFSFIQSD